MLRRVAQPAERLEVAGRRTPAAAAVGGEPGQLAHGGDPGRLVGHGLDGPQRILEAVALVGAVGRFGPVDQVLPVAGGGDVGGVADVGGDLGGQRVLRRQPGDGLDGVELDDVVGCWSLRRRGALCPWPAGASTSAHSRAPSSRCPLLDGLALRRAAAAFALPLVRVVPGALLAVTLADLAGAAAGDVAPPGGLAGQRRALVGLSGRPGRSVPGLASCAGVAGGARPAWRARIRRRLIVRTLSVGRPSVGRPTWRRRSWGRRCGPVPTWVRRVARAGRARATRLTGALAGAPRRCRSSTSCAAGTGPAAATGAGPARPAPSCGAPGAAALGRSPVAAAGRSGLAPARRSPARAAAGGRTSAGRTLALPGATGARRTP